MAQSIIQIGTVIYSGGGDAEKARVRGVIVYGNYSSLFIARFPGESYTCPPDDRLHELQGEPIPLEHVLPTYNPDVFTEAPKPLPKGSYIKHANTLRYMHNGQRDNHVSELVRHEALACEVFKRFPHPNIASYLGCQVVNDMIIALCFEKYSETLHHRLDANRIPVEKDRCLKDIRMGIKHMHTHGYGHNDINPHNVMFNADGMVVLIDFDSCRPLGDELGTKSGTYGFFDKNATTSKTTNDYYGLEMIDKYITERVP